MVHEIFNPDLWRQQQIQLQLRRRDQQERTTLMLNRLHRHLHRMSRHDQRKLEHDYQLPREHPQRMHQRMLEQNQQLNQGRQRDSYRDDELLESMRRHRPRRMNLDGLLLIWDMLSNYYTVHIRKWCDDKCADFMYASGMRPQQGFESC